MDLAMEVANNSSLARGESIVLFYCNTALSGDDMGISYRKFSL